MNSRDPIARNTDAARALFEDLSARLTGRSAADVVDAAASLVVNALRQSHPDRTGAERAWDESMGRAKANLMDCYDSTGRKKGVFPYTQHLVVPHLDLREKR